MQVPTSVFWALAMVAGVLAAFGSRAVAGVHVTRAEYTSPSLPPVRVSEESLAVAAELVELNNVFRPDRKPAGLALQSAAGANAEQEARSSIPTLLLQGIVGGPPWSAVIRGFPGREAGVLLQPGDTVGSVQVVSVSIREVVLAGLDTTWVIRMDGVRP